MMKSYERPLCEVYKVNLKSTIAEGSLGIYDKTVTDAGWAREDIPFAVDDDNSLKPQSLWEE